MFGDELKTDENVSQEDIETRYFDCVYLYIDMWITGFLWVGEKRRKNDTDNWQRSENPKKKICDIYMQKTNIDYRVWFDKQNYYKNFLTPKVNINHNQPITTLTSVIVLCIGNRSWFMNWIPLGSTLPLKSSSNILWWRLSERNTWKQQIFRTNRNYRWVK